MRWLGFLAAAMLALPTHAAEPRFVASSVVFEPVTPSAGSVVSYTVTIANTGDDSPYTRIVTSLPPGYLIGADGDCATAALDAGRLVWHEGSMPAGARKECRLEVLTRSEAAGSIATLATEITTPPSGYFRIEAKPTLLTVPAANTLYVGPIGITPAGLATLALLGLAGVGAVFCAHKVHWDRKRMRLAVGAWIAIVTSVGFLFYFVSLAHSDLRSYTDYRETSCQIVDSVIRSIQSSGKSDEASTYAPEFAVRYDALGVATYSIASLPETSLTSGSSAPSQQTVERFAKGSVHPCWFDPDDLRKVLLIRGPGGAYFFVLLPLVVLVLASGIMIGVVRSSP